jgi:hypothetical protein
MGGDKPYIARRAGPVGLDQKGQGLSVASDLALVVRKGWTAPYPRPVATRR